MEQLRKMDRQIKLGELVGFAIVILTSVISAYVSIRVHVNTVETEIQYIKQQRAEDLQNRKNLDEKTDQKLDKVIEGLNEIKVEIQNKADKK
jgi:cadmium resistance protein CadD (predicted permease)